MPDPLTLMQEIIEAYKHWRANPTTEHWAALDRIVRLADTYAKEIEAKLHPAIGNRPEDKSGWTGAAKFQARIPVIEVTDEDRAQYEAKLKEKK